MERSATVDNTLDIFLRLHERHGNVGICLQAYLRRTAKDLEWLSQYQVPIRLVKGFYSENDFKTWAEVTENYARLLEPLLLHSPRPAVATHDLDLVEKAKLLIRRHNAACAEIQFFAGVRDALAVRLVKEGFWTRVYVPYGPEFRFLFTGLHTFDLYRHLQRMLPLKTIR